MMNIKLHKNVRRALLAASAGIVLALTACGGEAAPEPTQAPVAPAAEPTKVPAAIVEKGKTVFNQYGCQACHAIQGFANGAVGPALDNLYTNALKTIASEEYKRSEGKATTAEEYIREAVLNPNAFVVAQCPTGPCPKGVMIQNFKDQISESELEALIGYLMTLGR
ncbi:MAG: c-type cytochrome [Thermoflexales bacterium]|nr:c-type cytochrome [Thermoflexales bacterium]MDW8350849.1 c-type cytochrome [Anaerolineae bacterium]